MVAGGVVGGGAEFGCAGIGGGISEGEGGVWAVEAWCDGGNGCGGGEGGCGVEEEEEGEGEEGVMHDWDCD